MSSFLTTRIGEKLVVALIGFCSLLTLVSSLWQLHGEYRQKVDALRGDLQRTLQQASSQLEPLVGQDDTSRLEEFLRELISSSGVAYAAVDINPQRTVSSGSTSPPGRTMKVSCALPVSKTAGTNAVRLELASDLVQIKTELRQRLGSVLLANGLKIFLIGGFTLLLFQHLVTRHLVHMASEVEQIDITGREHRLQLSRSDLHPTDELDQLLGGIQRMQDRGRVAYQELRESERRLLLFFNATCEGVLGISARGVCTFANTASVSLLGYRTMAEITGSQLAGCFAYHRPGSVGGDITSLVQRAIQHQQPLEQGEGVLRRQDGRELQVALRIYPVMRAGQPSGAILFFRDITSEQHLQRQLITQKKMEALDRLSSAIAHELGNPLFGIRSVVKDLLTRNTLAKDDLALLELAYGECERMRHLLRELRRLDCHTEPAPASHDLRQIVNRVLAELADRLEQEQVAIATRFPDEPVPIFTDRHHLELVFLNLIVNSIEAMSGNGGRLQIAVSRAGDIAGVTIRDTGDGIPEDIHELVYEPFFSTKSQVEGIGLGLTVARSIVRGLGGEISFASGFPGTVFQVTLPCHAG